MARQGRWLSMGTIGLGAMILAGCASLPDWAVPTRSLADDITQPAEPRLARLQASDGPAATLRTPMIPPVDATRPPIGPPPGLQPASLSTRGAVRVSVRVWVNGRPIFDDEVMQMAGPEMRRVHASFSEPQRSEKIAELMNSVIDSIVDQEVLYQDAVKRLEANNPRGLDMLKEFVDQEFDKSLAKMRQASVPEEQIRELEPVARRMLQRSLISTEYARTKIKPLLDSRIGLTEIREYYETHKNEFQAVDKVVWQDIFIPLSANHPTIDALKRFAEDLISRCRTADDFNRLMVYNEGDSKLRGGEGLGQRRGEIRPAELEETLFSLPEGVPGPVIAFATGVHLMRVSKREYAGQLPLSDEVQKLIRKKLESQLADREYRQLVRELRARSVVRVERDSP